MIMTCTYLNSHLLEAPREYILHGSDPGLDWASFWSPSSNVFLVCYGPSSLLLFVSTDRVSHPIHSLLSGRFLTNLQVNNITLHDTHWHTNIHHISHTILLPFTLLPLFLAGWLVQTLPVWHNTVLDTSSVEVPRRADGGVSYLL